MNLRLRAFGKNIVASKYYAEKSQTENIIAIISTIVLHYSVVLDHSTDFHFVYLRIHVGYMYYIPDMLLQMACSELHKLLFSQLIPQQLE